MNGLMQPSISSLFPRVGSTSLEENKEITGGHEQKEDVEGEEAKIEKRGEIAIMDASTKDLRVRVSRDCLAEFVRAGGVKRDYSHFQTPGAIGSLTRNPKLLCSAVSILGTNNSIITCSYSNFRHDAALGRLIVNRTGILDNVFLQQRSQGSRSGITCIRFDWDGVLFAVCSSSGSVRIYDFDECLGSLQLRQK